MRAQLRPAVVLTALLCLLTGFVYPGVVTGLAHLVFPWQANGSLVRSDGRIVGSALIGQRFTRLEYFHPRPSAAGQGYDPTASGGSNKGPTDRRLADTLIAGAVRAAVTEDGAVMGRVPSDRAAASASGLDPDISPANAELQVARVARARHLPADSVRALVRRHLTRRQFGLLGEPRVNVLLLNLALDSLTRTRRVSFAQ
jgi:K+-transporting ATPase ATPase C chain